jgi:methyl-accepting chemotaxis protein
MKFSIHRVQKFITVLLTLQIIVLLYQVYLQQSKIFSGIVGALSLVVFLSYILSSGAGKRAEVSIWLSTLALLAISFCTMVFLKGNSFYFVFHILLQMVLIFYFRKAPIYVFSTASIVFFMLSYFVNDQFHVFPENYSLINVYLLCVSSIIISIVILFVMKKLSSFVDFGIVEQIITKKEISQYLDSSEITYIFYLKAIADNITSTALEIRNTALGNLENIVKEKSRLQNVVEVAKVMQKTFFQTIESIGITKDIIETTLKAARTGEQKVIEIMEMVNKMMKFVDITKKSIYELISATKKVEGVIHIIDKIAGQTRLLSLNASIEGARFVGKQSGFTMVSKEVKELAALTHLSVQDITNTMRDINTKTKGVQEIINKEGREALGGLEVARLGEQSIKYVVRMLESIQSEINEIFEEMEINKDLATKIMDNFMTIESFIEENFDHMEQLSTTSYDMKVQGDHLSKIIHARQISELLSRQNEKIYSILTRFVMEFELTIENALRRSLITEEALFSREYNDVTEGNIQRYRSKYDGFFESTIQGLIDNYMSMYSGFKYFVVMDNEGYIPLSNAVNSTEMVDAETMEGGKWGKVEIINKGGVLLQDYVSKQAIKSESLYSLQCVMTADPIMDMSVRLHFKDRYWGAVRAGFQYS